MNGTEFCRCGGRVELEGYTLSTLLAAELATFRETHAACREKSDPTPASPPSRDPASTTSATFGFASARSARRRLVRFEEVQS